MTQPSFIHDNSWKGAFREISSVVDVSESASRFGVFQRARAVKSPEVLLRLALCHAAGLSLKQTAAWAEAIDLANLSAPALHGRLANCGDWLEHIVGRLIGPSGAVADGRWSGFRLRVMDATNLRRPGHDRTTWRVHVSYSLTGEVDGLAVTDDRAGEHLTRFDAQPGDICIADRGYAKARDIRDAVEAGADVAVRVGWRSLSLLDENGSPLNLSGILETMSEASASFPVLMDCKDGQPPLGLRLIIAPLPPDRAEQARKKVGANIRKRGKKADPRSLTAAGFLMVVTSLDEAHSDADILELYRLRWQIELLFKRFKSLAKLGDLAARTPGPARAWIFAKLILAILAERTATEIADFSPSAQHHTTSRGAGVVDGRHHL